MDGAETPKSGNAKVTRDDWLGLAERVLVSHGVSQIKILKLAEELGVSRSSFYWYFESRDDLLAKLLDHWEAHNTATLVAHAERSSPTIWSAITAVFECWLDPGLFDPRLDFAIREWARRSGSVRARVDRADEARIAALKAMFRRHGYQPTEAFIRARVMYFMQIGYYALVESEPAEARLAYTRAYLMIFSGREPGEADLADATARLTAGLRARGML